MLILLYESVIVTWSESCRYRRWKLEWFLRRVHRRYSQSTAALYCSLHLPASTAASAGTTASRTSTSYRSPPSTSHGTLPVMTYASSSCGNHRHQSQVRGKGRHVAPPWWPWLIPLLHVSPSVLQGLSQSWSDHWYRDDPGDDAINELEVGWVIRGNTGS